MSRKRFRAEEVIHKLREAEVLLAEGKKTPEVCRNLGVTEQTYYRWRREYVGLKVDQAKKLKELGKENSRLKKRLAAEERNKAILKEAASGNFSARRNGDRPWNMCGIHWAARRSQSVGLATCWDTRVRHSVERGTSPEMNHVW